MEIRPNFVFETQKLLLRAPNELRNRRHELCKTRRETPSLVVCLGNRKKESTIKERKRNEKKERLGTNREVYAKREHIRTVVVVGNRFFFFFRAEVLLSRFGSELRNQKPRVRIRI